MKRPIYDGSIAGRSHAIRETRDRNWSFLFKGRSDRPRRGSPRPDLRTNSREDERSPGRGLRANSKRQFGPARPLHLRHAQASNVVRTVLVDAVYWVGLAHRHDRAVVASRLLGPSQLVTTHEVLDEFLAHFSGYGPEMRRRVTLSVRDMFDDPAIEVIPQFRESFLRGLSLIEARLDKGYSLTDCSSMETMRREGVRSPVERCSLRSRGVQAPALI